MTRRETILAGTAVLIGALLYAGALGLWWRSALRTQKSEHQRLAETARDLQRLRTGRDRIRRPEEVRTEDASIISQVERALSEAHLPTANTIGSLSTRSREIPDTRLRLQTAILELKDLDPGDLGEWLAAWRSQDHHWRLSECQLTHRQTGTLRQKQRGPADNERYDVRLVMVAPYWEEIP